MKRIVKVKKNFKRRMHMKTSRYMAMLLATAMVITSMPANAVFPVSIDVKAEDGSASEIPSDAKQFNRHYYKLYEETITWKEAQEKCEDLGGYLVTITSPEENAFVKSIANHSMEAWLGGYWSSSEDAWKWVNGETWEYTAFSSADDTEEETAIERNWLSLSTDAYWQENSQTRVDSYICEWEESESSEETTEATESETEMATEATTEVTEAETEETTEVTEAETEETTEDVTEFDSTEETEETMDAAAEVSAAANYSTSGSIYGKSSTTSVDFSNFLMDLKVLESYANDYVKENPDENATQLVINYIRTGVYRYNTDSWVTIAGKENTNFYDYVAKCDSENGTEVENLKGASSSKLGVGNIKLPNGDVIDFGHMFGALNVSSNNSYNTNYTDFGTWLGDTVDLVQMSRYVCEDMLDSTDIDALVTKIREEAFGKASKDVPYGDGTLQNIASAFTYDDVSCDLDVFYLVSKLSAGESISELFEAYFTESLNDADRAAYFLNNRFSGSTTQEAVRSSLYKTYTAHVLASLLEEDREIASYTNLKEAACYVVADYLYGLADGKLVDDTEDPTDPTDPTDSDDDDNKYYNVFSSSTTTLAPGISQQINYALTADEKQIVYYISTVDINREDVSVYANYANNDASQGWAMSSVTSQMNAAQEKHSDESNEDTYIENYSAVVGVNADYYDMSSGQPSGTLIMDGVEYHGVGYENFFAILKDGTPLIGGTSEYKEYKDQIQEAVGGGSYLVKNGEIAVGSSDNYYTSRASRTCVGITADGQVVLMALDGRQEPFSAGGSAEEIAQIMLDAGCVSAINLDGGGSTTFAAKQEGEDEISVVNRPSDGYERNVSSSLLVVSTANVSTEFDHALLSTDTDYLTVNSTLEVGITGVSSTGNAADVPEGAYLRLSDDSIGTISGTTFTAKSRGTVDIELVVDDQVVGTKTLTVIRRPDALSFTQSPINATYGVATTLPLTATYNSNPVTISPKDITFTFSTSTAGTMDGFDFTGNEDSGVKKVTITAAVATNALVTAQIVVSLYSEDETIFDFDSAMNGDRSFAWNREVGNTITLDDENYYTIDVSKDTPAEYTFAIDIQALEAPESLAPLMEYLAGFSGTSGNATPWDYMLALAARVNTNTNVTINLKVAEGVDVDISNLSVVNDYFKLSSAKYDKDTRTISLVCNWQKQDGAISADTANSICILNGVVLTPSDDAEVDSNNKVTVGMAGSVSYDIYLRSSQLYALASNTTNQESYGIYPYVDEKDTVGAYGGHFSTEYINFTDKFYISQDKLNGWVSVDDNLYYYKDNEKVTGVQYITGYDDKDNLYFYNFDNNGICTGKVTGLVEIADVQEIDSSLTEKDGQYYYYVDGVMQTGLQLINGYYYYFRTSTGAMITDRDYWVTVTNDLLPSASYHFDEFGHITDVSSNINGTLSAGLYYSVNGVMYTGWRVITVDGVDQYYYFDPETGAAVDGVQKIDGYTYTFTDKILTRGDLVTDSTGSHYKWAGEWVMNSWVVIDGNKYYAGKQPYGYFVTDINTKIHKYGSDTEMAYCLFDENGVWQENYSGLYTDSTGDTYLIKDGYKEIGAGLVKIDGYYYYFRTSTSTAVKNRSYWITVTNDLLPEGTYTFDENGRMTDAPDTKDDPDDNPETPTVKDGIVSENGSLYYYVNGVRTGAGLIKKDGDYYYVRTSNGEVIHGRSYWVTLTNDLLPAGIYTFDEDGKMIDPPQTEDDTKDDETPTVKNGIVEENGSKYCYVDGVMQYGLQLVDGSYYYFRTSTGAAVVNRNYWITVTNNYDVEAKSYYFDESGKMTLE